MTNRQDVWSSLAQRGLIKAVQELFDETRRTGSLDGDAVRLIHGQLSDVFGGGDLISMLLADAPSESYWAAQALKTAAVSGRLARALRYPEAECLRVGMAGLVHDMGMALVDSSVVDRPGPLEPAERARMQEHCLTGYRLVRAALKDERIALVALQHHERLAGTGYPNGFREGQIHPYAKIVAIADVCCAMTADRPHRAKRNPLAALIELLRMSQQELDPYMVKVFVRSIVPDFYGKTIVLSDGSRGTIAAVVEGAQFRPLVRVGDRDVDLSRSPELQIVHLTA
ncbi:HD-GYP domain-containing protein [Paenibacillus thermoaerophilus]|uniref:HD-GYP domain-containing protein n=1 Tax=Paenibacillus thermoaerophilus TaxID=1215385 RepID=A0ABW2UWR1_9BACL|nr:HD domain-containing phosphohydrolase [Paenibacillus thermoaerophilus]TMV15909.1 HD domain-containing protein [Paenibacillus thermoaerophilus]